MTIWELLGYSIAFVLGMIVVVAGVCFGVLVVLGTRQAIRKQRQQ
jgi:hypothetical protein